MAPKSYETHELEMIWLKVEPPFEPLRSDPRWQECCKRVSVNVRGLVHPHPRHRFDVLELKGGTQCVSGAPGICAGDTG